jgi:hypothetical protein
MKIKKVISIQAESFVEEQYLADNLSGAVWHPSMDNNFHTFYIPEEKKGHVQEVLQEWDILNRTVNKKKKE